MKRIAVIGLGWSGSTALDDLLREYASVRFGPDELDAFRRFGMMSDHIDGNISEHWPSRLEKRPQLSRQFNARNFVRHLLLHRSRASIAAKVEAENAYSAFCDLASSGSSRAELVTAAQRWCAALVSSSSEVGISHIVFRNPYYLGSNLKTGTEVLCPDKTIVVFRDPRDQVAGMYRHYVLKKNKAPSFAIQDALGGRFGRSHEGVVLHFVHEVTARLDEARQSTELGIPGLSLLPFEFLVFEFPEAHKRLQSLLELDGSDWSGGVYFRPVESQRSVGGFDGLFSKSAISAIQPALQMYHDLCNSPHRVGSSSP